MIFDNPPAPGHGAEIIKAVVIATLSALTGGLVQWGLDELKERMKESKVPHIAEWTPENEEALKRAQEVVRQSAEKFGPMGRPADSSCACQQWPCPCACHKPPRGKP